MEERLQKIIVQAGMGSRRIAEQMIRDGRVSVNGIVVTELGTKADSIRDEIRVDERLISTEVSKVYLMLNKPRGYLTTMKDPRGRPIVTDLMVGIPERVFPIGRLDYDSEGLLFMTNDGDFSYKIQHPKFKIPKTYEVKIRGNLTKREMNIVKKGIQLSDGYFKPAHVSIQKINKQSCWLRITISEGRNRVVRRFFESMGHPVARLIRISIGNIELEDLRIGQYRPLRKKEIRNLMNTETVTPGKLS